MRFVWVAGYLTKKSVGGTLSTAIREVHKEARMRGEQNAPGLTPRESEVLQLAAEWKENKESADVLGSSIKTVEKHRQRVMEKLNIHDTARLTRHAISTGMIEVPVQVELK